VGGCGSLWVVVCFSISQLKIPCFYNKCKQSSKIGTYCIEFEKLCNFVFYIEINRDFHVIVRARLFYR